MFESFNLNDFGKHLKIMRKSLGFTQKDVEKITGITCDSLRRIEQGTVLLRYDTLILLSMAYKKDLLEDLKTYSNSGKLLAYYTRLEDLIINYRLDTLQNLQQDYFIFTKSCQIDAPINFYVKDQLEKILSGISKYNSTTPQDSLNDFVDAMQLSNPLFKINNYHQFKYTVFELRILLLIALALSSKYEFIIANEMLTYSLKQSSLDSKSTLNEKLLIIKIYFNLAYNYHELCNYNKALEYSNKGVDFCNKEYILYGLAPLLYRKGIAEYFLNKPNYLVSLQQSIHLLHIEKNEILAEKYVEITHKSYGISLSIGSL
ncbi:helix-turn-helix domain-containing protein [Alkaliphilus peptidifermentans]|uniref:Helix-turn-helix n=1 Tax=Alkaliphilus peptidifermentans DSM 18978 TaxID=1120976 RepID=A0A1G5L9G0_9FIRM|nr:helix-turn-helix transcriptional regulator [Alkaliphilus peptidifermentans]SCZ09525.1 Helix-turn-helix [Alkaliphilus peptidifermentans DSM 18978]